MKNRLNPLHTFHTFDNKPPSTTQSPSSPFARDFPGQRLSPDTRLPPPGPTSLPLRTSILEEPKRLTQNPLNSAVSPRFGPFSLTTRDPRHPGGNSDVDYTLRQRLSGRKNSTSIPDDAGSPRGDYDTHVREDVEVAETSAYPVAGLKRRASSPPSEEPMVHTMASKSDLRRREPCRGSPTPCRTVMPTGSGSSVSSKDRSRLPKRPML